MIIGIYIIKMYRVTGAEQTIADLKTNKKKIKKQNKQTKNKDFNNIKNFNLLISVK